MNAKPKILVILGPTAVGKSDMAVSLAKKFNGEIISADSRQVFKGMDIGTGKITEKEMLGVKHYLLDIIDPMTKFNVAKYKKLVDKIILEIIGKGKLPIICGGTGFYIQAVVDNVIFPDVKPNEKLRALLEKYTTEKLLKTLEKLDEKRFKTIDQNNRVRIIRAIEIAKSLGSVPKIVSDSKYNVLQIGITAPDEVLRDRIYKRLIRRMNGGMVNEIKKLHKNGMSWKRMEQLGLEYRYLSRFLTGKYSKAEMLEKLNSEIWQFARRQKSWFRRDNRIRWYKLEEQKKIEKEIKKFAK
ncbi:MAG: tRNA (adenosine(37)-N6)-dimethylallyltransferase MiaA [Minisyncoccia bacterium]